MKRLVVVAIATVFLRATPTFVGGYNGFLETYKLQRTDGFAITMYVRHDMSSPVLASIPSGTVVRLVKGNPDGWILVDYKGVQGCVMGSDGQVLCIGNIKAGGEE